MIFLVVGLWILGFAAAAVAGGVYRRSRPDRSWRRLTIILCVPAAALVTLVAIANQGFLLGLAIGLLFTSGITLGSAYRWRQKTAFRSSFQRRMEANPNLQKRFEKHVIFRHLFNRSDDSPGDEASRTD